MMTRILSLLILCAVISSQASEYIRATLTITNSTTTNDAFTVNGSTRRGAGTRTSTTWITNASPMTTATNIYTHLGGNKPSGVLVTQTDSNVLVLEGISLTLTASNFAALTLETNSTSVTPWTLMLPPSAFLASVNASNASALVTLLASATNQLASNAVLLSQFASLIGAQTLANKTLTAPAVHGGSLSNVALTNATGILRNVAVSNANVQSLVASNPVAYGAVSVFESSDGVPPQVVLGTWTLAANSAGQFWLENIDNGDIPFRLFNTAESGTIFTLPVTVSNSITATHGFAASNVTARTGMTATNAGIYGSNTWGGTLAAPAHTYTSLVVGDNSNLDLGTNLVATLSGAAGAVNLHSFAVKETGRIVFVEVTGATSVTIYNESGTESTDATRRITTGTGGNVTMTNQPATFALRRNASSRWQLWSHSR